MIRYCSARHDCNGETRKMMTSLDGLQMVGNYDESFTVWFEGTVLSVTHYPPFVSLTECTKLTL